MKIPTPVFPLLFLSLLLGGCASVDLDAPKSSSYQLADTDDTRLGQAIGRLTSARDGLSGFQLQLDGLEALASRMVLAAAAERSIDVQYYLITDDRVGLLFTQALLDAADRGVRVRVLLDDILAGGYDEVLVALDQHPNFEVRIFNPFTSRRTRVQDALFDFARINRRMHNKSYTIDNQVTITGGRNIADEYFAAAEKQNFGDADVMCVGPIVREVSSMYDDYWNSRWAAPVAVFAKTPDDPGAVLRRFRERLAANLAEIKTSPYGEAVRTDALTFIANREDKFAWAPHRLIVDPVTKIAGGDFEVRDGIAGDLAEVVAQADDELFVISPYFVPLKTGVAYFQQLIDRGLRVRVLTNSLAANNHGIVHSGYMPYRKELLRMGVELYEVKVQAEVRGVDRGGSGAALATLHTKAFLVDDDTLFLGSFNWDPRSAIYNTELGVVIESAEIGADVVNMIDTGLARGAYRLELDEKGSIRWLDEAGPETVVLTSEPDVSWWRLLGVNLGRLLPIRKQL